MKTFLAFVFLLIAPHVFAASPCDTGAKLVYTFAQLRDEGFTSEHVERAMTDEDMADSVAPWTSEAVVQMIRIVFKHPDTTPKEMALDFYAYCMQPRVAI